eukprot:TRINITY_DN1241_c0_g5_i1.p1 TRINITY_DN1241_c0_g5~~TRINITY_DN1241_c0_g5_i1.p1  ORF type:complete len:477 (-),score=92.93 TRINITY_DN1241_c0_g5_i1:73-1362(-)
MPEVPLPHYHELGTGRVGFGGRQGTLWARDLPCPGATHESPAGTVGAPSPSLGAPSPCMRDCVTPSSCPGSPRAYSFGMPTPRASVTATGGAGFGFGLPGLPGAAGGGGGGAGPSVSFFGQASLGKASTSLSGAPSTYETEFQRSEERRKHFSSTVLERDPWTGSQSGHPAISLKPRPDTAMKLDQRQRYATNTIGKPLLSDIRLPYTPAPVCIDFRPLPSRRLGRPRPRRLDYSVPKVGALGRPLSPCMFKEPYVEGGKLVRLMQPAPPRTAPAGARRADASFGGGGDTARTLGAEGWMPEDALPAGRLGEAAREQLRARMKAAAYSGLDGRQLRRLFACIDKDGSGTLQLNEVRSAVRHVMRIPASAVSDRDIAVLFRELDVDDSGAVDVGELLDFVGAERYVSALTGRVLESSRLHLEAPPQPAAA